MLEKEFYCACGKNHVAGIDDCIVEKNAVNVIPSLLNKYGVTKPFIFADVNTFAVGGEKLVSVLESSGIPYEKYIFPDKHLQPDERTVGVAATHFDKSCTAIIGLGSGVINDVCKIIANLTNLPYIIVGSAPSMDGYASATSSMEVGGLKVSLKSKCANVIIGDLEILKNAPMKMMISGLGDMLAKYVSICEWRISNLITREYYCETIAEKIRNAVKLCVENADGLLRREEIAVEAVFSGLIMGGVAMNYAGCSRPASGVEHYFSHIWDMRGLEFGTPTDFHGVQCAVATLYATKIYEQLIHTVPDEKKALAYVESFDYKNYIEKLRAFLGKSAEPMIELEYKEGKYDKDKHRARLKTIIENYPKIVSIIKEELMPSQKLSALLKKLGLPQTCEEIGIDSSLKKPTFIASKDMRDKYVLSRLCWDLGIIDEIEF